MLNSILDNVGTMVAFRSKSSKTEKLLLHQFSPYVEHGEILNLPAYNFYMKIAAIEPQEPLSGETVVLAKDEAKDERAKTVIKASRKRWPIEYSDSLEDDIKHQNKQRAKQIRKEVENNNDEDAGGVDGGLLGADAPASAKVLDDPSLSCTNFTELKLEDCSRQQSTVRSTAWPVFTWLLR